MSADFLFLDRRTLKAIQLRQLLIKATYRHVIVAAQQTNPQSRKADCFYWFFSREFGLF